MHVRLLWDFFGPTAEPTARHFAHHLIERLRADSMEGARARVEAPDELHAVVVCELPTASADAVTAALRPTRREPVST